MKTHAGKTQWVGRSPQALAQLHAVLLLGHTSEIGLLAAQNCLETLSRGVRQAGQDPTQFDILNSIGKALGDTLAVWGWSPLARRWGCWGRDDVRWDISSRRATCRKAHDLRDTWRVARILEWINSNTRTGSRIARQEGVRAHNRPR